MPTDEAYDGSRARTGPRHAAPRKPLLARLHMPAGKAVAIAAMPTAVLMGMGLTPQLAMAKPTAKGPFEGACATVPDQSAEPDADASKGAKGDAEKGDAEKDGAQDKGAEEKGDKGPKDVEGKDGGSQEKGDSKEPGGAEKSTPDTAKPPGGVGKLPVPSAPSPSPSATKSVNPLDPLGLGDKLGDILTGGAKAGQKSAPPSASPSQSPSASASRKPASPAPDKSTGTGTDKSTGKAATPSAGATPGASASPSPTPSGSASPSASPSASASPSLDPDNPPPCPAPKVVDENEKHAFPNQPWFLESDKLTLGGLTYQGIKRITTVNGQEKSVLKFTADSVGIGDLHQIVNGKDKQNHVAGRGTTSTITGGQVTMYTEELKGKLLGLLPANYTATSPPPMIPGLKLPIPIFFTDVKIRQAGQFGGTLHVPNLHLYITDGTYP
ncbi:hypothetical protein [Streptomyces sp. ISL-11]|uniref:hypothetical protein n=1 Tax=Streptomyces sp. ISL-11 TaxID=2819174 RepID=UPI001BE8AD2E|nr:hypothetical protein [Streptomyces sp. ISL-11]MBT2386744.1 hypothetical protein [Streptomyces sp. ISL-11]